MQIWKKSYEKNPKFGPNLVELGNEMSKWNNIHMLQQMLQMKFDHFNMITSLRSHFKDKNP